MARSVAILAGLLSLLMLGVGALGIFTAHAFPEWPDVLALEGIDPAHWSFHWDVTNGVGIVVGLIGLLSAVGLWRQDSWARNLWLGTITTVAVLNFVLFFAAIAPYRFQHPTLIDLAVFGGLALVSWVTLTGSSVAAGFRKRPR